MHTRWYKAFRDLMLNKPRTLLVIISIALGVFGFGTIVNSYSILIREMDKNYMDTNPASFVLHTESVNESATKLISSMPEIKDAEPRKTVIGRLQTGRDEWLPIWLFVIEDFNNTRVDVFEPEKGLDSPAIGEIVIERAALPVANTEIGRNVSVKIPAREAKELKVVGSVHAPGLPPAWMENITYGFISRETLEVLGDTAGFNELRAVVSENRFDREYIRSTAVKVKQFYETNGLSVDRIEIPEPGKHPHSDQMSALLFLLQAFGLLALVLSGVLVINMISAMMASQIRQIGIMKTLGATRGQIIGFYYGIVLFLGTVALFIAMPLSAWTAKTYARFAADMLNFDIASYRIQFWTYLIQIAVGLLVPVLAASYPIFKGSRVTIRESLGDYGVNQTKINSSIFDKVIEKPYGFGRPLLLSLRNTFRRKGRLLLTLGTLTLGGAIFIVAINVGASIDNTIENSFKSKRYSIELKLSRPYPITEIERSIQNIPGVSGVECWGGAMGAVVRPDGGEGGYFSIKAPPPNTELVNLPIIRGRWLQPDDQNSIVINHTLLEEEPGLKVGDEVAVSTGQSNIPLRVVGIAREIGSKPTAYMNYAFYAAVFRQDGYASHVFVATSGDSGATYSSVSSRLEQAFRDAGLDLLDNTDILTTRKIFEDHMKLIAVFLVLIALLTVIIGGLGLMSTMSINVMERIREIGIMRSIGATDRDILRLVMVEGIFIGLISWLLSSLLSIPLTAVIGNEFGNIFLHTPLNIVITPWGILIWLVGIILATAIASFFPARNASRMALPQVLAYE